MPSKGTTGAMKEVHRSRRVLCLEWRIPQFLGLSRGFFDYYESPLFCFSDACWHFRLYPEWLSSGRVSLHFCRDDSGPSTKVVNVSVGIRGSGGVVEKRSERERKFEKNEVSYMYDICTRSDLCKQRERLVPEEALTVTCEMKRPGAAAEVVTDDEEDEADADNVPKRIKKSWQQNPDENPEKSIQKLSEEFGKVLASGDKSDVTVQVGEQEFRVHSLVLFVRCPALSVSLRHESAERASNRIVVEHCEPDIFRDFLHFLYTGSVRSLTKDNAFALYRIADRYLVDDLKRWCLDHIQDALSVDTFCDALRLALLYGESNLLDRVIAFATGNLESIVHSAEWQDFCCECPAEALTKDNAFGLYQIADRYQADDLKRRCLKYIQETLSLDTFCDALRLALLYGESDLMDRVIAFATGNLESVVHGAGWQDFCCEYPAEASEVFQKSLAPPPKRQKSSR